MIEITLPAFPLELITVNGQKITYEDWCNIQVDRIKKIPGRSPRIETILYGRHRNKIMVVDDIFTFPKVGSYTDGVVIARFHETREQW